MPTGVYARTEETRKILSEAGKGRVPWNKGKKCPQLGKVHKGQIPWNKGKKGIQVAWNKGKKCPQISEAKEGKHYPKLSDAKKGKPCPNSQGDKHYNWKGGISPENIRIRNSIESRLWREAVFARDNWTCQKCGQRGVNLNAHHILDFAEFPELRTSIKNGITLCDKCHNDFHREFGKKNNTKEQLDEFLEGGE